MLTHTYMNSMQWNQSNISCIQSMQSSKCPAYHRCQTDLTSNGSFNSVKKSMNPIDVGSYFLAFPIFVLCIIFAYRVHWKCWILHVLYLLVLWKIRSDIQEISFNQFPEFMIEVLINFSLDSISMLWFFSARLWGCCDWGWRVDGGNTEPFVERYFFFTNSGNYEA